ncbi:MAG: spondin domain-containing protein [Alphaproteobacteria bacterium]
MKKSLGLIALALLASAASAPRAFAANDEHSFEILISNVSSDQALKLPDGSAIKVPIAPGAFAVISGDATAFRDGEAAGSLGLEQLAEDGNAEPLIASLKATPGVRMAGLFVPGQSFEVVAAPGDRLVFATMFVQSNDLFFAPRDGAITLLDGNGNPTGGELTSSVALWDAGTEVNQQSGVGSEQAPRQSAAGIGTSENAVVHAVADGFTYPRVDEVVRVVISPR